MPQWMDRLHALTFRPTKSRRLRVARAFMATAIVLGGLAWYGLTHRTLAWTQTDPTGRYTAICSNLTYFSFIPMMPGQSSDKPCFVKIVDRDGRSHGEVPVPMLQMAEIEWTPQGGRIKLSGEWDFATRTCRRW